MAKLTITDTHVIVSLSGIRQFLALKSSLTIPITSISKVSTEGIRWVVFAAKAGTNFSGLLMAWTFFRRGGMAFYYVRDPNKCVSLTLDRHRYRKVVVQVDDKEKTAEKIRRLIRK